MQKTKFYDNFQNELKNTRIFISIDKDDANAIHLLYEKTIPETDILFEYASLVEEKGEEIQFSLTVNKPLFDWCQSMINDKKDLTGIFFDIISAVKEKNQMSDVFIRPTHDNHDFPLNFKKLID